MDGKKRDIIEAAIRTVTRYGIKKTSMTDIAFEAGVSRQTLYSHFNNREAIWLATIEMITVDYIGLIESGVGRASSISEELEVVFEQIAVRPYDILVEAPELHDIVNGFDQASQEALKVADAKFCELIARLLGRYDVVLEKRGVTPIQLAEMIFFCCKSLKQSVKDRDRFISMVEALKKSILSMVED